MAPVLAVTSLETVCTADSQKTLQAGEDGRGFVCVQELDGEIHEGRPFFGEVPVQNALQDGDELWADQALGGG